MHIDIIDEQTALLLSAGAVSAVVKHVIEFEGHVCDEVSVHFVDEPTICDLHSVYFGDPSPTDCISFPLESGDTPGYKNLGDVFVCPQAAILYARLQNTNVHDEVMLYVVHGLLHLMGYDDVTDLLTKEMRQAEARHLAELKKNGLSLIPAEL